MYNIACITMPCFYTMTGNCAASTGGEELWPCQGGDYILYISKTESTFPDCIPWDDREDSLPRWVGFATKLVASCVGQSTFSKHILCINYDIDINKIFFLGIYYF
jgi:hypothetical protein